MTEPMSKEEFLAEVARIHDEWAPTARVIVDPEYADNNPSQYTEGIESVSAIAEDDAVYMAQIDALMDEYDRSNGRPTRGERYAAYQAGRAQQEGNAAKGRPTEEGE